MVSQTAADHRRALLLEFVRACGAQGVAVGTELQTLVDDNWEALGGPQFRCSMLVDTTCADPCDWALVECSSPSFGEVVPKSYENVFVHDV